MALEDKTFMEVTSKFYAKSLDNPDLVARFATLFALIRNKIVDLDEDISFSPRDVMLFSFGEIQKNLDEKNILNSIGIEFPEFSSLIKRFNTDIERLIEEEQNTLESVTLGELEILVATRLIDAKGGDSAVLTRIKSNILHNHKVRNKVQEKFGVTYAFADDKALELNLAEITAYLMDNTILSSYEKPLYKVSDIRNISKKGIAMLHRLFIELGIMPEKLTDEEQLFWQYFPKNSEKQ